MSPRPLRVTTVCSGNICRSPIAEVVLRAALADAGLGHAVEVDSAGLGGWHVGDPADRRARAVLRRHGYDGDPHRARQITPAWFAADDAPDLLLAMDTSHYDALRRMAPPGVEVAMMRGFDPSVARASRGEVDLDVPDPYYGTDADFEHVLRLAQAAAPGVVEHLRRRLDRS